MARDADPYEHLAELVACAQAGDRAAFEEVYQLTAQAQYFTIVAKTDADAAPDLLQEVYLIAWKNITKIRPRSFIGYLNAVTRNVCLRHYERVNQPREATLENSALDAIEAEGRADQKPASEHGTDPAVIANTRDERIRLARALREELDDREREIVLMRFYQDMRLNDIAETLDVTERTVRRTIKRALAKLRNKLGFIPFGPGFADLVCRAVESPLAEGVRSRPAPHRKGPLDHGVRAVAALSAIAVVGCVGFAAAAHGAAPSPQPIEENPVPAAQQADLEDTAAPELLEMRSEQGFSLLCFTDESGVADVRFTAENGTVYQAVAIEEADGHPDAVTYRFQAPSGTYTVTATDGAGNVATGEVVIDLPPDTPGPYVPEA